MTHSTSNIGVTLKSQLGVNQGHWKCHHSIDHIGLRVPYSSSIATIPCIVFEIKRYINRTRTSQTDRQTDRPCHKVNWWTQHSNVSRKMLGDMLITKLRYGRTDGQTDRRTDRQTDLLHQYRASVCWRAITRMVWLPDGEKISNISLFVLTWSTNVTDTDRQTDRQTDRHPGASIPP